jgi:putative ABC transport system ATP-binding protein
MVTHDSSLARRVERTVIIADGEVVNEYVARALPALSPRLMLQASRKAHSLTFSPGEFIIREGEAGQNFYMIKSGAADVLLNRPGGSEVLADRMGPGTSFGEISLFTHSRTVASVRAAPGPNVDVLALDSTAFQELVEESEEFRGMMENAVRSRTAHNQEVLKG